MMAVKQLNGRVILKHNTEENWLKATGGAAINAGRLPNARNITISGTINGFTNFNESEDVEIVTAFPDDIAISGTLIANKIIGAVYQ